MTYPKVILCHTIVTGALCLCGLLGPQLHDGMRSRLVVLWLSYIGLSVGSSGLVSRPLGPCTTILE